MIKIATILAALLLIVYLVLIGVQKSISDSWYKFPTLRWLFFLTLTGCGFLIAAGVNPVTHTILLHLACLGALIVAVAPNFKAGKVHKILHYAGAGMIVIFGYLGLWIEFGAWEYSSLFLLISCLAYVLIEQNKIFWFEVFAFGGLLFYLNLF